AEVPEPAHGFTIDTPDLKVVDLGTRFGVTAGAAGDSHVFVFEGEVKLDKPNGDELRRLKQGKTFHVNQGTAAPTTLEPTRFQLEQEADGWKAIPTSYGRGKDAFVRRGTTTALGAQPLLMVKHTELELSRKNERRIFLTFDLAKLTPAEIAEAQLVLDPEPSGLGFTAMVPDSRFSVYGVTDESLDNWNENDVRWDGAPASTDACLDASRTRKLAEFWIPRGGSGGPLTVRSDELAAFLRADTNGLATFIIVRETGETDPSGLVHAFASKEHPSARPPTLRVR
ncbi:MAG: DNRLRE domain-containing protein, partial [Verrucomicrobia bacterium]|nr:DNRLRE domain-containing protein [Verrucomicrobiota bacterium]